MNVFPEPHDPNETKDYAFDWSPQLASGETIASQVVAFVVEAGTTSPSNSFADGVSRVWLAGGTALQRAIFTIRITTDQGRTLEAGFAVDIVETTYEAPAETDVERLTREIAEAKAQRALVAQGKAVIDAWRDGRRIRRAVPTLAELERHIRQLEGELAAAQVDAGIASAPRRTAIGTGYA